MNKLIIQSVATVVLLSAGQCCTMREMGERINRWIRQLPRQPRGTNAQQKPRAHQSRQNNTTQRKRFTNRAAYNRTNGDTFDNDLNYYSRCRHFRTDTIRDQYLDRRRIFENITCPAIRNTPNQQRLRDVIAYGTVANSTNTEKITTSANNNWNEMRVPFQIQANQATYNCQTVCVQQNSVEAAINCYNADRSARIAILNFADPEKPGGGVLNGKGAQEETLSRCTTAYASLIGLKADRLYYDYNIRHWNDRKMPERILVSPNVRIILTDEEGVNKHTAHGVPNGGIPVAILTAAAFDYHNQTNNVWLRRPQPNVNQADIHNGMRQLVRNMLRGAIDNGCDTLVLGVWGTGVFGNSVGNIANYFIDILYRENLSKYFKKIVFAVPGVQDITTFGEAIQKAERLKEIKSQFNLQHPGQQAQPDTRNHWAPGHGRQGLRNLSFSNYMWGSKINGQRVTTLNLNISDWNGFVARVDQARINNGHDARIIRNLFRNRQRPFKAFRDFILNNTACLDY